eukprot:338919-Chlamydomonas_euryale.AAC.1
MEAVCELPIRLRARCNRVRFVQWHRRHRQADFRQATLAGVWTGGQAGRGREAGKGERGGRARYTLGLSEQGWLA